MAHVHLTLLGGMQIRLTAGPPLSVPAGKAQLLLGYLAVPLGRASLRASLAALLWGDLPADAARHGLRQALSVLRKALVTADGSPFRLGGEAVALDPEAVTLDVAEFERAAAEGTPAALEVAAALYRGDLLAGVGGAPPPFEEWLLNERERLHERALAALAKLLAHQRTAGAAEAAVQTALRLLALDPLQEPVHRTLMRLYADTGRRGPALRQYQRCASVLERELGVEPEPATKALYHDILRQRVSPVSASLGRRGAAPGPRDRAPDPAEVLSSPDDPIHDAPLIGRGRELAQLRDALAGVWGEAGGGPRLVAVLGEAGTGKSRLVAELAAGRAGHGRVLLGQAYETDQILPFGPWVNALRQAGVLTDVATLHGLDPESRHALARLFPELPRAESAPDELEPRRLFDGLVRLFESLARGAPRLVVLEDLHWADEMSVRLLGFLGRQLRATPTLVVLTARVEELGEAPLLRRTLEDLEREGVLHRLTLPPLSHADTLDLVKALARPGRETEALATLGEPIWAASRGNPFMIAELVRALREGTTILTPLGLTLPMRVEEVVARRLERLGERSRALAGLAALIAHDFDFPLLQRASGLGELDVAEGLEELVRRRILDGVGERFAFTHEAIRVVAGRQVLRPRARALHRRVAEALESLHAEDLEGAYAALGRHYREGEVWDKAVRYLRLTGAQALARFAHREALASFEQAREAVDHLPEGRERLAQAIDVGMDLYHALVPLGRPLQIATHLRAAEELAVILDDPGRLGWVVAYATNAFWLAGDSERARAWGIRAVALAETLANLGMRVAASFYLAQVHHFRGEYRESISLLRRTVASLDGDQPRERFGLPGLPAVLARGWLAWSLAELGEFAEGLARAEEGVHLAEAADHAFSRADAYRELGCLLLRKGDLPAALLVLEKGLALCRSRDLELWVPSLSAALGYAYALNGRVAEGTALLESALEQATALGIGAGQAIRSAWLGESYLLAGRSGDASRLAHQALDVARAHHERGHEAWALRLLGEIAAHREPCEVEQADAHYGQARALAEALRMRPLIAHCHRGLAALHQLTGNLSRARQHHRAATRLSQAMDMQFWPQREAVKDSE